MGILLSLMALSGALFLGIFGSVVFGIYGISVIMIGIAYLALSAYLYHLAAEIYPKITNAAVAFGLALAGIIGLLSGFSPYVIAVILVV